MDTGFFQLNDIVLNIPPDQINIQRETFNSQISTLRSRASIKAKSPYSKIVIDVSVSFLSNDGGWDKLRRLFAQFRVTPFCYVENKLLRDSIMHGDKYSQMALALRALTIVTVPGSPEELHASFSFLWFNYFPYSPTFTFNKDIFDYTEVFDPRDSEAWKLMYDAELLRWDEEIAKVLPDGTAVDPEGNTLDTFESYSPDTDFEYPQYTYLSKEDLARTEREYEEVKALQTYIQGMIKNQHESNEDHIDVMNSLSQSVQEDLNYSSSEAAEMLSSIFPERLDISGANRTNALEQMLATLKAKPSRFNSLAKYEGASSEWKVVLGRDGKPISQIKDKRQKKPTGKNRSYLFGRTETHSTDKMGIIVTQLRITLAPQLSTVPMQGYHYPTYQFTGGSNVTVQLSAINVTEEGLIQMQSIYDDVESISTKFREVPQPYRDMSLLNPVIQMFGLKRFIPDETQVATVPSQPESRSINWVFIESGIKRNNEELAYSLGNKLTNGEIIDSIVEIFRNNSRVESVSYESNHTNPISWVTAGTDLLPFSGNSSSLQDVQVEFLTGERVNDMVITVVSTVKEDKHNKLFASLVGKFTDQYGKVLGNIYNDLLKLSSVGNLQLHTMLAFAQGNTPAEARRKAVLELEIGLGILAANSRTGYLMAQDILDALRPASIFREEMKHITIKGLVSIGQNLAHDKLDKEILDDLISIMDNWTIFLNELIEKEILASSALSELKEFRPIWEKMRTLALAPERNNYPDFPFEQVMSILRRNYPDKYARMQQYVESKVADPKYIVDGLNVSSFIGPEFYLYNPIRAGRFNPSSPESVERIRSAMVAMHEIDKHAEYNKTDVERIRAKDKKGIRHKRWIEQQGMTLSETTRKQLPSGMLAEYDQYVDRIKYMYGDEGPLVGSGKYDNCASLNNLETKKQPIVWPSLVNDSMKPSEVAITVANRDAPTEQRPPDLANLVTHYYDENSLQAPVRRPANLDKSDTGNHLYFAFPVELRRVTSPFGWRRLPPNRKKNDPNHKRKEIEIKNGQSATVEQHSGIDFGRPEGQSTLVSVPIQASASGKVVFVHAHDTSESGAGVIVIIDHGKGWRSKYMHMANDNPYTLALSKGQTVRQGQQIGIMGKTGGCHGMHLHFQIDFHGKPVPPFVGDKYRSQWGDYEGYERDESANTMVEKEDMVPYRDISNGISPFDKSVEIANGRLYHDQGISFRRAYPTFRFYFVEYDGNERRRYGFDDFYSYSAIREVQLIRSRELATDLLILDMTNISGNLTNKFVGFSDGFFSEDGKKVKEGGLGLADTEGENSGKLASFSVKPGMQVSFRLGYAPNENGLERVFNGFVSDVEVQDGGDRVILTCQSFGSELVQNTYGESSALGGWMSAGSATENILENLLSAPELVHFGRWKGGPSENPYAGLFQKRFKSTPAPQDDNIFPPLRGAAWKGVLDSTTKFVIYESTIWDVFQEMTLRYPGYIASAVPYQGTYEDRMTMFYGLPDQLYFHRDPTLAETATASKVNAIRKELAEQVEDSLKKQGPDPISARFGEAQPARAQKKQSKIDDINTIFDSALRDMALRTQAVQPFRRYHMLTSKYHIIENSIQNTNGGSFNVCTLQYGNEEAKVDKDTQTLVLHEPETFTLAVDSDIPDEEKKEMIAQYPNCVGFEQAKPYTLSLLRNAIKEGYSGSVITVGIPDIKPYDICFIDDTTTEMAGEFEVKQVLHRISPVHGWVTEISPSMVVHTQETTTMATGDAIGTFLTGYFGVNDFLETTIGATTKGITWAWEGTASTISGVLSLGWASFLFFDENYGLEGEFLSSHDPVKRMVFSIFQKMATRSQMGHPFKYSLLMQHGAPMLGGLPDKFEEHGFILDIEQWFHKAARNMPRLLSDFYRTVRPSNWWGHWQGDFADTFFGEGGEY